MLIVLKIGRYRRTVFDLDIVVFSFGFAQPSNGPEEGFVGSVHEPV